MTVSQCKNCGTTLSGAYCHCCGQSADIDRITSRQLWRDIYRFLTHLEKGFWYTSWYLLKKPGDVIHNFLEGSRIRYQKPVSYFLIWMAIYLLVLNGIELMFGKESVIHRYNYFGDSDTTYIATRYMSLTVGILVPLFSLYLGWSGFWKYFNYTELLTAILYGQGTVMQVQTLYSLLVVIEFLFTGAGIHSNVSDVFKALYIGWFAYHLSGKYPVRSRWITTIAFTLLCIGTFVVYRIYIFSTVFSAVAID